MSSERPLRQFLSGKSKSAGRNSAGRITTFHRGGGAKRSQRTIDLKRNTSSIGVVERIEYDPNRTSRIAVVRWEEGEHIDRHNKVNSVEEFPATRKILPTMNIKSQGQFAFCSLPGMPEEKSVAYSAPKTDHVVVGLPPGSKNPFASKFTPIGRTQFTNVNEVFLSAFSSSKVKNNNTAFSFVSSLGLPRIAVAGAKPDFFVPRMKTDVKDNESLSLSEIKKWYKDSIVWDHKMKRQAAVSWQSFRGKEVLELVGLGGENDPKLKVKSMNKEKKDGKFTADRAPVTYILATHQMEVGKMVMNCDSSKSSNAELLKRY